jgi:hypothetical protein
MEPRLDHLLDAVRHPDARKGTMARLVASANTEPEATFAAIAAQELVGVFAEGVRGAGLWEGLSPGLRARIEEDTRRRLATHLLQRRLATHAASALQATGVPYLFFKGLHLQEVLYDHPALRPMADVDVFVPLARRAEALRALAGAGFTGAPVPATISHEVALRSEGFELDVHWSPFRPGRTRRPIGPGLLASRVRAGELWVPDDAHTTWLLLVHPVVTEHATLRLMRAVDLDRWVRAREVAFAEVLALLGETGLRTAAWVMCTWTRRWLGTPFPAWFLEALAPPRGRRIYLRAWLRADPAARFRRHPTLVRGAFGLSVQDTPGDALKALAGLASAWRSSASDCTRVAEALAGGRAA